MKDPEPADGVPSIILGFIPLLIVLLTGFTISPINIPQAVFLLIATVGSFALIMQGCAAVVVSRYGETETWNYLRALGRVTGGCGVLAAVETIAPGWLASATPGVNMAAGNEVLMVYGLMLIAAGIGVVYASVGVLLGRDVRLFAGA